MDSINKERKCILYIKLYFGGDGDVGFLWYIPVRVENYLIEGIEDFNCSILEQGNNLHITIYTDLFLRYKKDV